MIGMSIVKHMQLPCRYFKVNLDQPCNEWQKAEGHGELSVDPEEVPDTWVETEEDQGGTTMQMFCD